MRKLLLILSLCSNVVWAWGQQQVNLGEDHSAIRLVCGTPLRQDSIWEEYRTNPDLQAKVQHIMQRCLQDYDNRPITSSVMLGVGGTTLHDTYLTNQLYDGTSVNLSLQRVRLMKRGWLEKDQWFDLSYATTTQEASDANKMIAFRVRYSYAMHLFHNWEHSRQMRSHLFAGLCAIYNLGANYSLSMATGNNPANAHQTINLGLSAGYQWDFTLRQRPGDVRLTVQTPMLGGAFSPEFAQSYYTMYTYGDPSEDNFYFTSWHRQQDLDVRLTSDIPIRAIFPLMDRYKTAVRVGMNFHIETQKINHLITRYSYCQVILGWTWQHVPYKGKRL